MHDKWTTFLENKGAVIDDGAVLHFDEAETNTALTGNILADLSHYGLISVSGADAKTFLQGQFTNDVRLVTEHKSQLSAFCSAKGRVLANFRLFQINDVYFLLLPRELVKSVIDRLKMFVLMARVELEDVSDTIVRIGCAGSNIEKALTGMMDNIPDKLDSVTHQDGLSVICVVESGSSLPPQFVIIAQPEQAIKCWESLLTSAIAVGNDAWALLDIHAGVPTIYPTTTDMFVPQMINLQTIGGVSFEKGCYAGQEIIARMQYLGKLKRRMYLIHIDTKVSPQPADNLCIATAQGNQGIGKIVDARPARQGYDALAVIQVDSVNVPVRLHDANGPAVTFLELPYPVETAED